jgi:hypothetical protein
MPNHSPRSFSALHARSPGTDEGGGGGSDDRAQTASAALDIAVFSQSGVIATTPALVDRDLSGWRALASVQVNGDHPAYGLFVDETGQSLAMLARPQATGAPVIIAAPLPAAWMEQVCGNYAPLFAALNTVELPASGGGLSPLHVPPAPWPPVDRLMAFQNLIDRLGGGESGFERALLMLETALHERGAMIYGYAGTGEERLGFIQGLLALLPAHARQELTFSTNRHENMTSQARLVFAERHVTSTRWVFDLQSGADPAARDIASAASPYLDYLREQRRDRDDRDLLALIDRLDPLYAAQIRAGNGSGRLAAVQLALADSAARDRTDRQILNGEKVESAQLVTVLQRIPPTGDLRARYIDRLLDHAVQHRDAAAAAALTALMDTDPALDSALWARLNRMLSVSPDAVYALLRTHLAAVSRPDERWLLRLKAAALASLRIAFTEADEATILNWLQLIAREPTHYGLGEVLHQAIHSARQIAHRRGMPAPLIEGLISIAARRSPIAALELCEDVELIEALPPDLRAVLRDFSGDPQVIAETYGLEVLLLALWRSAAAAVPALFTPFSVETVWSLTSTDLSASASAVFAAHILDIWLNRGVDWMTDPAVETLLTLALQDGLDDRFQQFARSLRGSSRMASLTGSAFVRAGRSVSDILALVAQQLAVGDLTPQDAVDIYVQVLTGLGWNRETQPLIAQLARLIGQQTALTVPDEVIWRLAAAGAELRDEPTVRIAARRIQARLALLTDDVGLVEYLGQLVGIVGSSGARSTVEDWWRDFVINQPTTRLSRLERQLEARKNLDDLREIVHSVAAIRRLLGAKTLKQFADDIATAYALLQAFSDAFEPQAKRPGGFDPAVVRAELDARSAELPPEQLQILANTIKELADLIASLGDNRSRASLIRRSEDLDRQLITGEQPPHSAVDAMKWISGYLSGAQETDRDEDD